MFREPTNLDFAESGRRLQLPRRWRGNFKEAFRGAKRGVRGQSSFFVHFFFAALALAGAVALDCTLIEWCVLICCIGGVLTAELFKSAIETLLGRLEDSSRDAHYRCLDIAAGAVLVASVTAFVVGGLIFTSRLARLFA